MADNDHLAPASQLGDGHSDTAESTEVLMRNSSSGARNGSGEVLDEKTRDNGATPRRGFWRSWKGLTIVALAVMIVLAIALGVGLGLGLKKSPAKVYPPQVAKPNVLVIMTDDQDLLLDSMSAMPHVNALIGDQGIRYDKHYCTTAWCCPSRVNFFTGKAPHNTNVTSLTPPYGGWQKFTEQGLEKNYLPVWLHDAGINSYYVGKFMNGYSVKNLEIPEHPPGWTNSSFLVDPWTYNYYHSHWTNDYTSTITAFNGTHTTNVTQTKSLAMLNEAAYSGKQFLMMVAPVAPHQHVGLHGTGPPPVPQEFHGVYSDREVPKSANFNPKERSGASWVYQMNPLDKKELKTCDKTYTHRLGNLAAVDAMVAELIQRLDDLGILDNTYIVYTTDNGFHIGNHRLLPGKRCPYEEDVNIPLLIRGPGVPKGVNSSITNSHTDMAPTLLQMLGVPQRSDFDGSPIAYTAAAMASSNKSEIVTVEFWNAHGSTPLGFRAKDYFNNTYKALRLMDDGPNSFYYSKWCTGEREFHNMLTDAAQMQNLLATPPQGNTSALYYGRPLTQLLDRLDALLMVTKSCVGDTCRNPWGVLFPDAQVQSLAEAMVDSYDTFFAAQPKVEFEKCTPGYLMEYEAPFTVNAFGS